MNVRGKISPFIIDHLGSTIPEFYPAIFKFPQYGVKLKVCTMKVLYHLVSK